MTSTPIHAYTVFFIPVALQKVHFCTSCSAKSSSHWLLSNITDIVMLISLEKSMDFDPMTIINPQKEIHRVGDLN